MDHAQGTLSEIRDKLKAIDGLEVKLTEAGLASFLYVRSEDRAVEVSLHHAGVFVEYWETAEELSEEPSAKSEQLRSPAETVAKVIGWLQP
jgi:hypothetical protein